MESNTAQQKSKKQIIYEAAARLFRDKGYAATSMRDLAQAVELQASSLYNHIGSKEEILRHICFANAHRFLSAMEKVEVMDSPAGEKIRELIRLHVRMATEELTSVTAFNDEWRHLSEPHLSQFIRLRRDYQDRFRTVLEQGIRNGELKALNPSIILYSLFSSVRWLYDWYRPGGTIGAEELEDNITTLLMQGVMNSEI